MGFIRKIATASPFGLGGLTEVFSKKRKPTPTLINPTATDTTGVSTPSLISKSY